MPPIFQQGRLQKKTQLFEAVFSKVTLAIKKLNLIYEAPATESMAVSGSVLQFSIFLFTDGRDIIWEALILKVYPIADAFKFAVA